MREQGQYGREVRRYGKCWPSGHGQWDRRMPEVVAVDWQAGVLGRAADAPGHAPQQAHARGQDDDRRDAYRQTRRRGAGC